MDDCVITWGKPAGHWDLVHSNAEPVHLDRLTWDPRPPHDEGDAWGPWVYHPASLELGYRDPERGRETYWLDLERCCTGLAVLDWIAHLEEKAWCSEADLGYLVRALADIVGLRRLAHPKSA